MPVIPCAKGLVVLYCSRSDQSVGHAQCYSEAVFPYIDGGSMAYVLVQGYEVKSGVGQQVLDLA